MLAEQTQNFATKFFSAQEFPEKIVLQIEVKDGDWDLTICQRGTPKEEVDNSSY